MKWALKVWCAANASSRYIYEFDIYRGSDLQILGHLGLVAIERNLRHEVVTMLTTRLEDKGHVIVIVIVFHLCSIFFRVRETRNPCH